MQQTWEGGESKENRFPIIGRGLDKACPLESLRDFGEERCVCFRVCLWGSLMQRTPVNMLDMVVVDLTLYICEAKEPDHLSGILLGRLPILVLCCCLLSFCYIN